jgi:hypothetical protein
MANDPVVFPNTFMDGLDGRTPIPNFNGLQRVRCESAGNLQVAQTPVPTNPIVVEGNGFSRVGPPNPPAFPNGQETFIAAGAAWVTATGPGGWWPSTRNQSTPRTPFQTGIPVHVPYWSSSDAGSIYPFVAGTTPYVAEVEPSGSASRVEQPTGPEPRSRPPGGRGHR